MLKSQNQMRKDVKVEEIMHSPVFTVRHTDTVRDVAKLFIEKNISGAPVVDKLNIPIGVITKTDLCRCEQDRVNVATRDKNENSLKTRDTHEVVQSKGFHEEVEEDSVEEWMTPFVFDTHPGASLGEVAKKMVKYGFHHLFVTEPELKRVIGVITTFDILEHVAREFNVQGDPVTKLDPENPQPSS